MCTCRQVCAGAALEQQLPYFAGSGDSTAPAADLGELLADATQHWKAVRSQRKRVWGEWHVFICRVHVCSACYMGVRCVHVCTASYLGARCALCNFLLMDTLVPVLFSQCLSFLTQRQPCCRRCCCDARVSQASPPAGPGAPVWRRICSTWRLLLLRCTARVLTSTGCAAGGASSSSTATACAHPSTAACHAAPGEPSVCKRHALGDPCRLEACVAHISLALRLY
jgi:hypothetical protein